MNVIQITAKHKIPITVKRYLSVLFIIVANLAMAQDFGSDMMDWVKNNANKTSRKFTQHHWNLYWQNYHIVLHEKLNKKSTQIDSVIAEMIKVSNQTVFRVDTTSIAQYIQLKEIYNDQLNKLYAIAGEIENMKHALSVQPESLSGFMFQGYSHHGKSTLLESFAKINNGSPDISVTYGNTFGKAVMTVLEYNERQQRAQNGTGNTSPSDSGRGNDSDYTITFTNPEFGPKNEGEEAVYYTGLALMSSGEPRAALAGAIILMAYGFYKYFDHQDYKKQVELFEEAVALLPKKLIEDEEAYNIYKQAYDSVQVRYDSLRGQRLAYLNTLETVSASLIRHTFQTLSVCNNILHTKKIQKLSTTYFERPELFAAVFEHQRIITVAGEMFNYSKELRQLKLKMLQENNGLKKLTLQEQYLDAVEENLRTFEWIADRPEHLPLVPDIDKYLAFLEKEQQAGALKSLAPALTSADQQKIVRDHQKIYKSLRKQASPGRNTTTAKTFLPAEHGLKKSAGSGHALKLQYAPYLYYNLSGTYGSGTYSLSEDISFHHHFSNHGEVNIGQSIFDGGFNSDSRSPEAEVDALKENLARRMEDMIDAYQQSHSLHPQWSAANLQAMSVNLEALKVRQQELQSVTASSQQLNQDYIEQYREQVNNLLKNPVTTENLRAFFKENDISTALFNTIPRHHLRPSGYTSPHFDIRERFYGSASAQERNITYEAYKSNADFDAVTARFRRSQQSSDSPPDPVFENEKQLKDALYLSRSYLLTAKEITRPDNAFYRSNKKVARQVAEQFVNNARMIRYYSLGLIPKYSLENTEFFLSTEGVRKHLTAHTREYYSMCESGGALESSACNRFTTSFLKDVYGIGDFYNKPDGWDVARRGDGTVQATYYNTAQITQYVTQNWTELGDVKDQLALNMAGLMAGMGYAVIAVKPGHVCVVLPTNPSEYFHSGSWGVKVPYILNYSLTDDPNLNIKLNVPLNEGWGLTSSEGVKLYFKKQGNDY